MRVTFYSNFQKRKNSTKRPSGAGVIRDLKMKENTSVINPVFELSDVDLSYNYCIYNGRYYFIDNMILSGNKTYYIQCSIDIGATYRTQIAAYNGMIERCADTYDPYLYDHMVVPEKRLTKVNQATTSVYGTMFSRTGGYYFPAMNSNGLEIFATQYFEDFGTLFNPATFGLNSFDDWLEAGLGSLTNINQFFGKVIWLPLEPSFVTGGTLVPAGRPKSIGTIAARFDHDCYVFKPDAIARSGASGIAMAKPTPIYNDFRDTSPEWSQYFLYLPGYGTISIDPQLAGDPTIDIIPDFYFEVSSGNIHYRILADKIGSGNPYTLIGCYDGNMSATVPYADSQWAVKEAANSAVNGINGIMKNAVSENYLGMALSAVKGLAGVTYHTFFGSYGSVNSGSGGLGVARYEHNYVFSQFALDTSGIPNRECGRPLHRTGNIGDHAGYIQMLNADVEIAGFDQEKVMLNDFLNTGFYYE